MSNKTVSLITLVALSITLMAVASSICIANSNDSDSGVASYVGETSEVSELSSARFVMGPDSSMAHKMDVTGSYSVRLGADMDSIVVLDDPDAVIEKIITKLKSMNFDDIFSLFETGNDKYLYKSIDFSGCFNFILVVADLTENDSAVKNYLAIYNMDTDDGMVNGMVVLTDGQLDSIMSKAYKITDFKLYILLSILDILFVKR